MVLFFNFKSAKKISSVTKSKEGYSVAGHCAFISARSFVSLSLHVLFSTDADKIYISPYIRPMFLYICNKLSYYVCAYNNIFHLRDQSDEPVHPKFRVFFRKTIFIIIFYSVYNKIFIFRANRNFGHLFLAIKSVISTCKVVLFHCSVSMRFIRSTNNFSNIPLISSMSFQSRIIFYGSKFFFSFFI